MGVDLTGEEVEEVEEVKEVVPLGELLSQGPSAAKSAAWVLM